MVNKPYIVELSNRSTIEIDADEVAKVAEAISNGTFVKVRKGFINPSFVVDIVPDKERWSEHIREVELLQHPSNEAQKEKLLIDGCPKLKDAFNELVQGMKALPPKHGSEQ